MRIALALIAVLTLSVAPLAAAEPASQSGASTPSMHPRMHPMRGLHGKGMWQDLNLNADQQQRMKALHQTDMPKMQAAHKAVMDQERALMTLMRDSKSDDTTLKAAFDKVQSLRHDAATMRFNHLLAMRAILTPEQRQKLFSGKRGMGMMEGGPMGSMHGMDGSHEHP